MAQVINTNVLSLTAQRNLSTSGMQLATALQRLSSGLRINSAKDDAAGLAISNRFTTQINGLNQAARNANDGISLAQTAESALGELTQNLQRIRELAVQSANASNSASDRAALDQEVQQRIAEINRIASQTSFNGQKVLDGSFGNAAFQVGANVGETIEVSLETNMRASAIGQLYTATGTVDLSTLFQTGATPAQAAVWTTAIDVSGSTDFSAGNALSFTVGGDAVDVDQAYADANAVIADIQAQVGSDVVVGQDGSGMITFTAATAGAAGSAVVVMGGTDASGSETTVGADAVAGTPAPYTVGAFSITVGEGDAVDLSGDYDTAQDLVDAINAVGGVLASIDGSGQLVITAGDELTIGAGAGTTALGLTAGDATAAGSLDGADVTTVAGANDAILRVDAALTAVSTFRSTLGAIQGRFESTIANLQAVTENLSASRSRILDADFAAETANLTRAQILQQAGIAILAQANAVPQNVLSLLR